MATVRHNGAIDWTLGENVRARLRFDRPETRLVFFELPVEHLTRPDLRTVCLTLSTEEGGQDYAISCDFTGPGMIDTQKGVHRGGHFVTPQGASAKAAAAVHALRVGDFTHPSLLQAALVPLRNG